MRVRVGDKIYVQNFDIEFIFSEIEIFPEEISQKIPRTHGSGKFLGKRNAYHFDYYFEEKETISWLENQCWLIDNDAWEGKSDKTVRKAIKNIKKTLKGSFQKFIKQEGYLDQNRIELYCMDARVQKHIIFSLETILENRKTKYYLPPKNTQN